MLLWKLRGLCHFVRVQRGMPRDYIATSIIHQLSPLSWVGVCGEIYVIECVGAGFIRIELLTDSEGDFLPLSRALNRLTQKPRAGSQTPSALYPGNVE